jgi:hypothetical protein
MKNQPKTEDQLQAQIVTWFNNSYCLKTHNPRSLIFSVPNGGNRHFLEAMKFKATGLLAGASDLIVIHRSIVYFCELKTESGRLSPSQLDFEARVTENGFQYKIFRSLLEFQEFFLNL